MLTTLLYKKTPRLIKNPPAWMMTAAAFTPARYDEQ